MPAPPSSRRFFSNRVANIVNMDGLQQVIHNLVEWMVQAAGPITLCTPELCSTLLITRPDLTNF